VSTVPLELGLEVAANPLEILAKRQTLLVRELARPLAVLFGRAVQERVQPRLGIAGGRNQARVEVEIDADREPVLGLEAGEVTKLVPGDGPCDLAPPRRACTFPMRAQKLHNGTRSRRPSLRITKERIRQRWTE